MALSSPKRIALIAILNADPAPAISCGISSGKCRKTGGTDYISETAFTKNAVSLDRNT
ncbi:MAG: hypothetical protein VB118_07700 [Oscillospiraceae bacterium]|nr:hypothetical protein [Oscillospiraceae bacterium]